MGNIPKLVNDIIYVTDMEQSINYKWEKNYNKLNPEIQIVSIDEIRSINTNDFEGRHIKLNSILMKHPFIPNKYIDINSAEDIIINSKLISLCEIAGLLGAKEFSTLYVSEEIRKVTYDVNGALQYKIVEGKTDVKLEKSNTSTGKYFREGKFKGDFSDYTYQQAVEKARFYGLDKDEEIKFLLTTRNPQYINQLTSQKIKIELTDEFNNQLDVACSLAVSSIFSINASYTETLFKRKKIIVESELKF